MTRLLIVLTALLLCTCALWIPPAPRPGGLRWKRQQHREFLTELGKVRAQRESVYARLLDGRCDARDAVMLLQMNANAESALRWAYHEEEPCPK